MNKLVAAGSLAAAALLIAVVALMAHSATKSDTAGTSPSPLAAAASPTPSTNRVTGQVLGDMTEGRATLVDVRTPAEFTAGHAKGAVNFDLARMQAGELPTIDKSAKIYLICRTGHRAGEALTILQQAGFTDVTNIGGLSDWISAGGAQES